MMLACQCLQCLCQTNESDAQCTMLQNLCYTVIHIQMLGINPDSLPHQKRIVSDNLGTLNLETVHQLTDDKIHHVVQ